MNLDEAIKLVVTLHTPSEKLQREIIAKDMDLGADYMGEFSRLSELTRFAELTRFLLLFPIILTLRLHGKRVVPLRRDPG